MAAPQIPNLNGLRSATGRGRSRGGGRGGTLLHKSELEQTTRDTTVQQTDQDASVSRLSAVQTGYLEDRFARVFAPKDIQLRFPIINRGSMTSKNV